RAQRHDAAHHWWNSLVTTAQGYWNMLFSTSIGWQPVVQDQLRRVHTHDPKGYTDFTFTMIK
ncbi:MAG: hypothetical protein AAF497_26085, partial [Planctomycetota bacterium]